MNDKFLDNQYEGAKFSISQINHAFGERFTLVYDPLMLTQLAVLSSPEYRQPEFNHRISYLYENLLSLALNKLLIPKTASVDTRMQGYSWTGPSMDGRFITVAVARAGNLPSSLLFDRLSFLFGVERVSQDHLFMNRKFSENNEFLGIDFSGSKPSSAVLDQDYIFIPDPMGATGSTIESVVGFYKKTYPDSSPRFVCLNLIVTPEYMKKVLSLDADIQVFAYRYDRGLSDEKANLCLPGTNIEKERGLNDNKYIVPGAGGLGELMNNSEK